MDLWKPWILMINLQFTLFLLVGAALRNLFLSQLMQFFDKQLFQEGVS